MLIGSLFAYKQQGWELLSLEDKIAQMLMVRINGNYYNNVISTNRLSSGIVKNNIINNVSTLNSIRKNEIDIPFIYLINKFFSIYNRALKYFKKNDVKAIFVNCFYSVMHQAIIYAAKKSNVKVLEIQHGVIGKNQYYYNPTYKSIDLLLPDYLLAHNQYVSNHIKNVLNIILNNIS